MIRHTITIYFDLICAWSYIGHRTLFQGIALFQKTYPGAKQDEFHLTFRPYYRDRSLPDVPVALEQRLNSFLGPDAAGDMKTRVVRIGRNHGINFTFDSKLGSTRSAHRLIYALGLSKSSEAQRALIEMLYFRWCEVGADITSYAFLAECAEAAAKFPASDALVVLEEGRYGEDVDRLDAQGREDGVSCVPTFDINGVRVEGAEDTAAFYELFVKHREENGEKES